MLTGWTFSGVSQVSVLQSPKSPTGIYLDGRTDGRTNTDRDTERKKLLRRDLASPSSAGGDRPVCKEIEIRSLDPNRGYCILIGVALVTPACGLSRLLKLARCSMQLCKYNNEGLV